jgi:sulfate transport system permease protein
VSGGTVVYGAAAARSAADAPRARPSIARLVERAQGYLLVGAVVAYLGVILLAPLAALVAEAARTGVSLLASELASEDARFGLRQSLVLALVAIVANGVFGVAGALVLVRQRFRARAALDALVDLTIAVSPVMTGLAFLLLVGRGGWLAPALDRFDLRVAYAFPALVLCTLFVTLPFTLREVAHVLEELGTDEEQVAATLGATPWQTFVRVTLPNVRHALVLGTTLTAARALGEFGAVLVVGGAISGKTQTATTFIYAASEERRDAAAFGMALVLALASALLLIAMQSLERRRSRA